MFKTAIVSLLIVMLAGEAFGSCKGTPWDPATGIAWNGLFPIRIGGTAVANNSQLPDGTDGTYSPICTCTTTTETYLGLDVSFWDIDYLVEITKDAWCSPTLGTAFSGSDNGFLGGTVDKKEAAPRTFKQAHWLMFPAFKLLGLMTDNQCLAGGDFAFGFLSELSPLHNNDYLADLADPKSILVANPAADLACAGSLAIAQLPGGFLPKAYDSLFWCWFDNIYPLSGNMQYPHSLTAAAQVASRQIYTFTESGSLEDYMINSCHGTATTLPKKSQWRFQIAKPVKGATPFIAGQSELSWGTNKNPPYYDENFLFVLFQKKRCCQKLKGSN